MSANVMWEVVQGRGKSLKTGTPSAFNEAMTKVWGDGPWELGDKDVPFLLSMSAVERDDLNPYQELADIIQSREDTTIKVWLEY